MKALLPNLVHCPQALPSHHQRPKIHLNLPGKNPSPNLLSIKPVSLDSNSIKRGKPTTNTSNNISSSGRGDKGDGGGGGGGGFKNTFSPQDNSDSSSFSSTGTSLVAHSENPEEDNLFQVRSFCCMNVGPVFDGDEWRAFSEEEMDRELWRPCVLPCYVQAEIMWELVSRSGVTERTLTGIKEQVEEWYRSEGYSTARVVSFTGLEKGVLCCRINEGTITDVRVRFRDSEGNETPGRTCEDVISRALPAAVTEGLPYNTSAAKEALRRLLHLNLFEKANVELETNELGGVSVQFLLEEKPQDGCYFQSGLSYFSSDSGKPILSSLRPAATLAVEHRNISGMNRCLHGYIHSNDLFSPQDDSRFKLVYVHPYIDGALDSRERIIRLSCYNSRRLTGVICSGENQRQAPATWVDRAGLKANITEKFSKESKLSYGFVIEEVATRDGVGSIQTFHDDLSPDAGGIEHVPFFQAKITRNNTCLVKGARVGAVDTFQLDQGVGVGSKTSFFNKHQLSSTRFIPLQPRHDEQQTSLPLAILKARYGGIVGAIPAYRAFTNLRASSELGRCTSFLELMSEVRIPVRDSYLYAYMESFTELDGVLYHGQSLRSLVKNAGTGGTSLGVGVKSGDFRTEFVFDCSSRTGSLNVQMGDRI